MTDLVRITGGNSVGLPIKLADGSQFIAPAMVLITDKVTDGAASWVKTYGWSNGVQATDSGWVKQ